MRILIAEDDPVSRRLLEAKLVKWDYEVVVTKDGNEAWLALQEKNALPLAILDWMMPGMDGVEVCRKVRERSKEPYTYIILLTALQQEEDLVAGMEAGADDYIAKPFKSNELKVRLRAGRRIIELQDELITAREALRAKATHDPLTGLWNHEEILRILDRE
jgi:two-component system cell cycle response regulator